MYKTLQNLIQQRSNVLDKGVTFVENSDKEDFLSYADLYRSALNVLAFLQNQNVKKGQELVFQVEDNKRFVEVFWACILGGIIPVPLTIGQNDEHKQKLFNIWKVLNDPFIICSQDQLDRIGEFCNQQNKADYFDQINTSFIDISHIYNADGNGEVHEVNENDLAFIQFSSGSTGTPKGVQLTHKNLLTNVAAIGNGGQYQSDDSMVSWMPLTHDMGLIGFHINPVFSGMNHYIIPTNLFVRRPSIWLEKASEHQITVLCSPNFGYKYILKHCPDITKYDLDLSAVRILYNGAEPISESLCYEFLDHVASTGLKRNAMCPVYGLAEASLAVSMSHLQEEVISYSVDRNQLIPGEKIQYSDNEDDAVSFVNVGKPINDCLLRIADEHDQELEEEAVGYIHISGDNVTSGYYNNPEATAAAVSSDQWIKTGDLGFMKDGCLYVTGRAKDILFVNGQNFYPHDLERVAEGVDGIELNKIAIVGWYNKQTHQEEVVAFVFHRGSLSKFLPVHNELGTYLNAKVGVHIDRVIPTKDIPRTTSGKLQRFKLLERFKAGVFEEIENELNMLLGAVAEVDLEVPANESEDKLLTIWKSVLNIDNIGVTQGLFEIGGNSLRAAEIAMMVTRDFHVELPAETFYTNPTVRDLANTIKALDNKKYEPIPTAPVLKSYPLSPSQRRLYYAWKMNSSSLAYNVPVAFELKGTVDTQKIEEALKSLISRHDALQMTFEMSTEPRFKFDKAIDFELTLSECDSDQLDTALNNAVKPFDLEEGPLFRAALFTLASDHNVLFIDFHHIISDGLSVYNFVEELLAVYSGSTLARLEVDYKEYVLWESSMLLGNTIRNQGDFWSQKLSDELPLLDLPLDFTRPPVFSGKGETISFQIDKLLTEKLRTIAGDNQSTLHALLFTAYYVLLSKYSRQKDIIIGIPVAGRRHVDSRDMLGMFVNNLAIRSTSTDTDQSFLELLSATQANLIDCFENQYYPFDFLIEKLDIKSDASRNPLFDTMFNYQNMGFPTNATSDFSINKLSFDPGFSKFDLSMEIFEQQDVLSGQIEYATDLFERETIIKLREHFNNLLQLIVSDPQKSVKDISLMTWQELNSNINEYNDTAAVYPVDKTIHSLFQEQVCETPEAIAIESLGEEISYSQLDSHTNYFAGVLREKGVQPNEVVGVLLPRSIDFVTAILSVLKSGAAYVPIDVDLPKDRIDYILEHSNCKVLITESELYPNPSDNMTLINVPTIQEGTNFNVLEPVNAVNDLAYVIYTSGTTGKPKGVMIEHQSLVNYISWAADNYLELGKGTFPLYTSVSFDLTITSIFTPLLTGNKVVVYPDSDQELLIEQIVRDNKVEVVKLTPSHLRIINDHIELPASCSIKRFIVGGEDLDTKLANDIYHKFGADIEIFNEYGPTEATVGCMIQKFDPTMATASVPIGIPASNTQIYLLDEALQPVAIGIKGDLYIAGDGLARGYLNNETLTNERFVDNPFVEGTKMYKSGDEGKRLQNGLLLFLGRADQQVKINGYRIEIPEIESAIADYSGINKAVVNYVADKKALYAYYIPEDNATVDSVLLRTHLAGRLPHYMIPLSFIGLEEIPLTQNGKIDYNLLPDPEALSQEDRREATSDIEEAQVQVWQQIFGDQKIAVNDNFFELGGDSIKAVQISSRLMEKNISVNVKDILTYQTIEQITPHTEVSTGISQYYQGTVEGNVALTPIASWFFNQGFFNPNFFNQSILLDLNAEVSLDQLSAAFTKLVELHDELRMNYNPEENTLFYNKKHVSQSVIVNRFEADHDLELKEICRRERSTFDITTNLLIKPVLIHQSGVGNKLFITAHHLIIDGVSWRILMTDLYNLLKSDNSQDQLSQFRKTASLLDWEKSLNANLPALSDNFYWDQMSNNTFKIPQDAETNDWRILHAGKISGSLGVVETEFLIKEAHKTYQTDVQVLLNTALAITLSDWTNTNEVVVEYENHGRHLDAVDVSRTIGWFTAMYPVSFQLEDERELGEHIKAIKEQMKAVPHHGLGYGLNHYTNQPIASSMDSRTEVRFNYLGQFDQELSNDLFSFNANAIGEDIDPQNHMTTKLEWNAMVVDGQFKLEINYNQLAHGKSTIGHLSDQFIFNLNQILNHIKEEEDVHFTPSDFEMANLDQEELDALF